ncbi:MAG: dynamin family protein [Methylicorpusculum sp.]|uniref:dynamin family protein n=1 Tax=Methylicorpusculum sp. TaxID=2713644 RepID=UPI00271752CF|nr:dynamin family protein [Methylicorpusculum sp.]MDO8844372.1 dynamin family protein [Methylicorpusculum sp.]MDO8940667.1 dynamin family protein [Methylicorpusculum sp.]MDO9240250.1 dynamin family protein [Methylicorpusculum sp.]MDP2180809.1 dynamin family protein [Methylicorpusculum sp.]MDP2202704.1 dynamin family protein [Methylicorpusculum sp.]
MRNLEFKEQLHEYSQWRSQLIQAIEMYQEWRQRYAMNDIHSTEMLLNILHGLESDRITLAFVAEFSRGKTELINALFFAETGVRLLPSSPGRTTMSPTELFYDEKGGHYIRLLNIESRLEDISLSEYKKKPERWNQIDLDFDSPTQMQEAFKELVATKRVPREVADKLGLWNEKEAAEQGIVNPETVEIPCWRHALISFPHPLLKEGLCILDTPGLNALGTEPELTLNMLPSAQAIIFVLAADTGVTKSDLEMWRNHVSNTRGERKQGLAVVMNKIDAMWDDLAGDSGYEASIKSQIKTCASILNIDESLVFPASAKQALLAKVKSDDALLLKSRLFALENYLANDILKQRRNIILSTIKRDIGFLVTESSNLTDTKLSNASKQLEEFKKIDFENHEMTDKLMAETRDRQQHYMLNIENFQASRKVFSVQAKILVDSLSSERIDEIIKNMRIEMAKSLTTYGMKQSMRKLFDELREVLQDCVDTTNETRRLVKAIHKKFQDEYGFKEIEPQLFSIKQYQFELEQIFEEGEAFRNSARTTMTEQSIVINKLYSTLINRARTILKTANKDATTWCNSVLTPLMHQIKDHKKQIESRLQMLRKINESKGSVAENITQLEQELEPLKRQRNELSTIIKAMQMEPPPSMIENN